MTELAQILSNVFRAIRRGEVSFADVRDYVNFLVDGSDYQKYIRSAEWRKRANAAKKRVGYRCQVCNRHAREIQIEAHHRTYERIGMERPEDITVLCRDCHELYEKNKRMKRGRK